jgi:glycogen(starch) synthase
MRIVVIAFNTRRALAVSQECAWALDHGAEVHLVTVTAGTWPELDPRLQVHELRVGEGRLLLPRGERALVFVIPRWAFGGVRKVLKRLTRTPARAVARPVLAGVDRTEAVQKRVSTAFHSKVFVRFYSLLRPWMLWRVANRRVLPGLDLPTVDQVVIQDPSALALGWNIARKHPNLDVSFDLDRARFAATPSSVASSGDGAAPARAL